MDGRLPFMKCWLIINENSGGHAPSRAEAVADALKGAGCRIDRVIALPGDSMPDADAARATDVELIAVFAGDGTINAAVRALEGWEGDLLILPGGTMNLLSRKLHGDAEPADIVRAALARDARHVTLPVAEGCGLRSLVGIIAGPTAAWGDVREDIRNVDLGGLVESVPQALKETLQGDLISVEGVDGEFQAIFLDPKEDGLRASGIDAGTAAELLQHGWAWLKGDFREGPRTPLICAPSIRLRRSGDINLLVDGEQAEAKGPCRFTLGRCGLNFIATRKE